MMRCPFACFVLLSGLALGGCQSAPAEAGDGAALVVARRADDRQTWWLQEPAGLRAWTELGLPETAGNLQLAPAGGTAVATVGAAAGGRAELRLWQPGGGAAPRVLAAEWVWDSALRADGAAVAWIEGADRRRLRIARAPDWRPADPALPGGAEPAAPRWGRAGELLAVLREAGRSRLVALAPDGTVAATWYQVSGDVRLAEPLAVAGAVLVLEAPADGAPRRLLRLAAAGAAPTVLAAGYFAEGTLRASPDGKAVAAVWHESLAAVQRREAGLRWIGPGWAGLPGELPRVTGFAWSPDGRRLAVGRHEAGRDWVELYPAGAGAAAEILGSSPQWWSSR